MPLAQARHERLRKRVAPAVFSSDAVASVRGAAPPMPRARARHERLRKRVALAVFSSDAMSSVAYATEEVLLILVLAGTVALHYSLPIALAITTLLVIVVLSYQKTIHAYTNGGGAYIVARDNLGDDV